MSIPTKPPVRPGAPPPGNEDALGRSRRDKDELQLEVQKIEEELEALKARYEQYFLGIERREPSRLRDELKKRVMTVKGAFTRNASLRFRIQTLHARFLSYERLWLRSAREREEGTYRRDLFKARLRSKPAEAKPEAAPAPAAVPAARTPAPAAKPTPPPPGGVGEAQLRAIYDAYVAAKRQCHEDVSKITYDTVAKTVTKQVPELMARFRARSVEFKVEVKDGRAILKAIPKT